MPLIKPVLEAQIFAALQKLFNNTSDTPVVAQQKLAKDLASAIDGYIKSATIIVPPGQGVQAISAPGQVVGSPATPPVGATLTPGTVAGATSAPSPPATIS
jgi:hypothetical protein